MRKKIGRICALVVVGMFVVMTSMSVPADDPDDWTMWGDNTNGWEFLGTLNNDDLRIVTNGMQRMVVTSGGNVGIGTPLPAATLHVAGGVVIDDFLKVDAGTLYVNNINHRVGIGTGGPDSLLHVSAGDEGDAELILESNTDDNNNADNPCITFRQDGNDVNAFIALVGDFSARVQGSLPDALVIGSEDANVPAVQFAADDEVHMTIWVNGMVGIGTTWPVATLDVDPRITEADIDDRVGIRSDILFNPPGQGNIMANWYGMYVASPTVGDGDAITNRYAFVTEADAGNVGIGTVNPSSELDVNGDIEIGGGNAFYFGDPDTDGSWRITRDGDNLVFERREIGIWVAHLTLPE